MSDTNGEPPTLEEDILDLIKYMVTRPAVIQRLQNPNSKFSQKSRKVK